MRVSAPKSRSKQRCGVLVLSTTPSARRTAQPWAKPTFERHLRLDSLWEQGRGAVPRAIGDSMALGGGKQQGWWRRIRGSVATASCPGCYRRARRRASALEALNGAPARHRDRCDAIADALDIFEPGARASLRDKPLQQIRRDHLLAGSLLLDAGAGFDEGCFVFLFPRDNLRRRRAVAAIRATLRDGRTFAAWPSRTRWPRCDVAAPALDRAPPRPLPRLRQAGRTARRGRS